MGHISDRTLDNLLDGSIDDAGELAIEEHVRHCDRCAHRLREWEQLFPQVRSLRPTGEHPVMSGQPAFAAPRASAVFIPDWSPPPSSHSLPTRIAWALVVILAVGAGYILIQKTKREAPTIGYLETPEVASAPASGDSSGLGSGIPAADSQISTLEAARIAQESALARARASLALEPETPGPAEPEQEPPPPPVEAGQSAEQDVRVPPPDRERPVSFPIRAESTARQPTRDPAPAETSPGSAALPPLPTQFQRVTLGEAISRLAGTVRLIQGLNPEAVEIAQGSVLPGADPGKPVVRVVYNAPEGRLIMDQQRLGRAGSREPNIAISTAPNGVSVAQWVDRGGFWISLAGRADQQTLLAIANRIK